jgi:hypothetical protein
VLDWLKRVLCISYVRQPGPSQPTPTANPGMNDGDFHSGPHGYSPNTAYPETQYGSWFDEEADWNEEHHQ